MNTFNQRIIRYRGGSHICLDRLINLVFTRQQQMKFERWVFDRTGRLTDQRITQKRWLRWYK